MSVPKISWKLKTMSSIIVHTHHLLREWSQADSKQQPPKVRGTGPKDPAKSRPEPAGKAVTEMAAMLTEQDVLQVRGLRKSRQIEAGRQIKMLEQAWSWGKVGKGCITHSTQHLSHSGCSCGCQDYVIVLFYELKSSLLLMLPNIANPEQKIFPYPRHRHTFFFFTS